MVKRNFKLTIHYKKEAYDYPQPETLKIIIYRGKGIELKKYLLNFMLDNWVVWFRIVRCSDLKTFYCEKCQLKKDKTEFLPGILNCKSCWKTKIIK